MRVLQIHNRYRQPGGEDRVADAEAKLLEANGHTVGRLLADNPRGLSSVGALAMAVWNPSAARRIERAADEFGPDVAHVHNTWFALTAAAVSRLTCPVVMTLHNFRLTCANALLLRDGVTCRLCVDGSALNGIRYACYRGPVVSIPAAVNVGFHRWRQTWQRSVGLFLALTEFSRGIMVEAGLDAERVLVSPNFVDDPGPRETPAYESDTMLFVGRLSKEKGVDCLAQAIRRSRGAYRWVVIGDGPERAELDGLPGVEIKGFVSRSEVDRQMKSSRALVVPSTWYEGQPLAVLEAFAAGLPVLAADHGGLRETVAPLGPEFLVAPGDVAALTDGLERVASDVLVERGSAEARRLFDARHSPTAGLFRLQGIYRKAIDIGQGPYG